MAGGPHGRDRRRNARDPARRGRRSSRDRAEHDLALHAVVDSAKVGDRLRASGQRDSTGLVVEQLRISTDEGDRSAVLEQHEPVEPAPRTAKVDSSQGIVTTRPVMSTHAAVCAPSTAPIRARRRGHRELRFHDERDSHRIGNATRVVPVANEAPIARGTLAHRSFPTPVDENHREPSRLRFRVTVDSRQRPTATRTVMSW
jgi:hypothetical protein